jgi:acetylornithine deacetylase/succinyl-diaminopimelate desuccinylase-like protein
MMVLVTNHRELMDAEYALNSDAGGGTLAEGTGAPVLYQIQTAEKTFASFEITLRNAGGHSSRPRRDNAIYDLADVLKRIQAAPFPPASNDTTRAYLRSMGKRTPGALGQAMLKFADNPQDAAAAAVLSDDPSYIGTIRTTCVPTLLRGGHADNALPQSATVTINCRIFPGVSIPSVQARLQELAGSAAEIKALDDYASSDASPLRSDVIDAVTKVVRSMHPGVEVVPGQSAGATDGVFFRGAGIPTYGVSEVFIKDSDDFAHGLNERLPVKSFYDGLQHWQLLIRELAGRKGRSAR